jgi:hypothetical protein
MSEKENILVLKIEGIFKSYKIFLSQQKALGSGAICPGTEMWFRYRVIVLLLIP